MSSKRFKNLHPQIIEITRPKKSGKPSSKSDGIGPQQMIAQSDVSIGESDYD